MSFPTAVEFIFVANTNAVGSPSNGTTACAVTQQLPLSVTATFRRGACRVHCVPDAEVPADRTVVRRCSDEKMFRLKDDEDDEDYDG